MQKLNEFEKVGVWRYSRGGGWAFKYLPLIMDVAFVDISAK